MEIITDYTKRDETTQMRTSGAQAATLATDANRWLTLGAVAGPLVYTLAWFILGFVSPGYTLFGTRIAPYSPISQPISGLGLGITAPFMNAAFILNGLLLLIGVVAIFRSIRETSTATRWTVIVLLALSPLGSIVAGVFTLESFMLHFAGFLLGVATPVLAFVVAGLALRRVPYWRRFGSALLLGSPLTLALVVLYFATFDPVASGAGLGVAGLTQRVLVAEVQAWYVAMGWLAFRRP